VDYIWQHDGKDCWIFGNVRTNVGRTGGGNFILADRLLVTGEDAGGSR